MGTKKTNTGRAAAQTAAAELPAAHDDVLGKLTALLLLMGTKKTNTGRAAARRARLKYEELHSGAAATNCLTEAFGQEATADLLFWFKRACGEAAWITQTAAAELPAAHDVLRKLAGLLLLTRCELGTRTNKPNDAPRTLVEAMRLSGSGPVPSDAELRGLLNSFASDAGAFWKGLERNLVDRYLRALPVRFASEHGLPFFDFAPGRRGRRGVRSWRVPVAVHVLRVAEAIEISSAAVTQRTLAQLELASGGCPELEALAVAAPAWSRAAGSLVRAWEHARRFAIHARSAETKGARPAVQASERAGLRLLFKQILRGTQPRTRERESARATAAFFSLCQLDAAARAATRTVAAARVGA